MRTSHTYAIAIALFSVAAVAASSGCADDETNNTTSTSTSTSSSSSSSSSGTGGSGGDGGGSTGGGGSSSSGTGGGGGAGGTAPDACLTNDTTHVLIDEIGTGPGPAEFIEIRNPGSAAVDLTNYYLSDNVVYYGIAAGDAWNPPTNNPNTDFLVQFPSGTSIAANETLVIEFGTDYETTFSSCPDFTVNAGVTCDSNAIPQMVVPTNGGVGNAGSLLSNSGEMAMLFCWSPGHLVHDVDYVNWDPDADPNTHVDKTNVTGYLADTNEATQRAVAASPPSPTESTGRCDDAEDGETTTGGNGLLGHDETSETWNTSFEVFTTPTPGVANTCG